MRMIRVTGEGRIEVKPDQTVVDMELSAQDKDYGEAMAKAADSLKALEQSLEKAGLSSGLKTSEFSADAVYDNVNEGGGYKRIFSGYAVKQKLKLSFGYSSEKLFRAVTAVTDSGASPQFNIRFTVKDKKAISREAIKRAVKDAGEKAEALAAAAGAEIEGVESINYVKGSPRFYSETNVSPMMLRAAAAPDIIPEDVSVTEYADVTYRIRTGKKK